MTKLERHGSAEVAKHLDALALNEPRRAALCLADLYAYRRPLDFMGGKVKELEAIEKDTAKVLALMKEVVGCLGARSAILAELRGLPTIDSYRFCRDVLNEPGGESAKLLSAAVMRVSGDNQMPVEVKHHVLVVTHCEQLQKQTVEVMDARFLKLSRKPSLGLRNGALLSRLHELVETERLFPLETYGYAGVAKELKRADDVSGFAQVRLPWSQNLDLPNPACHQCNDSALTARSYFSSHGIPADVWVARIGGTQHALTVAYFEESGRFVPVVVDLSPYGGMYSVSGPGGGKPISLLGPAGLAEIRSVRSRPMPFMSGDRPHQAGAAGLLPWFSEELPNGEGRIVAMAGVQANQKKGGWLVERGTPEYYGEGMRHPKLALELTLFPGVESEFVKKSGAPCGTAVIIQKKSGQCLVSEASKSLSEKQIESMLKVAEERFPKLGKAVARLEIDLSKRRFK